ncbi:cupredoxin domain-containing protein [Candidatus Parcubacteria bacterium]|nr:cupredoxin domain-containing protein [Patescibacteria group bacterium]MBU4380914.1 cupredoxin domain-containing protein [Patescibacteria group bacterium]MCG2688964.1 cupredoxin domain-containing protein [Candidatus Parcubacteria bacterium]
MPVSKIFFGLLILAVVGLGGYYAYLKYNNSPVANKTEAPKNYNSFEELPDYEAGNPRVNVVPENLRDENATVGVTAVKITATGFSPSKITVKQGDIVSFSNEDTSPHQVYGEGGLWFGRQLEGAETFSQEFDVPGTYPYYDKLNEGLKGEVMVE